MHKQGIIEEKAVFEIECPICYENFQPCTTGNNAPILYVSCGHTICKSCMNSIKNESNQSQCPYCKKASGTSPNYSLIELLTKGYLTCNRCHYSLKTNLKECLFNQKGDFCFDCSKQIQGGLPNFSLVEAMEKYQKQNHICSQGKQDCQKQYDLKTFNTICNCNDINSSQDLFSQMFMNKYLIDENKFHKITQKVYEDSKKLFEKSKNTNNDSNQIESLLDIKMSTEMYHEQMKKFWEQIEKLQPNNKNNEDKKQKQNPDILYEEIINETRNFSEYNIDNLFKAAENNKLLQKSSQNFAGNFGKNVYKEKQIYNQVKQIQQATEEMNKKLKEYLEKFDQKQDAKQNLNFDYEQNPFLDIDTSNIQQIILKKLIYKKINKKEEDLNWQKQILNKLQQHVGFK